MQKIPTFHANSAKEWRAWLEKNHEKENTVILTRYKKHTKKPTISQQEAMDEAICFGWIDTTLKPIDDKRYGVTFRKRTKNSRWSKNTISYARRLIKQNKMTPAGLEAYKLGLKKPLIDHGIPKDQPPPEDLLKALNKKARQNFENLAPSMKFMYIVWIERAKMPETRKRRIKNVAEKMKNAQQKKKGKY